MGQIDPTGTVRRNLAQSLTYAVPIAIRLSFRPGQFNGSLARRRTRGVDVDVLVKATDTVWQLTDLLGRSMGSIVENASHQFTIYPEGHAVETMVGIHQGPHASLDAALAEIERHTRGVCRLNPGED
jgi:hypothetical protein